MFIFVLFCFVLVCCCCCCCYCCCSQWWYITNVMMLINHLSCWFNWIYAVVIWGDLLGNLQYCQDTLSWHPPNISDSSAGERREAPKAKQCCLLWFNVCYHIGCMHKGRKIMIVVLVIGLQQWDLKAMGRGVVGVWSIFLNPSTGVLNIHETKMLLLVEDPLPFSVHIGRYWCHSHDKCFQVFPCHVCTLNVAWTGKLY